MRIKKQEPQIPANLKIRPLKKRKSKTCNKGAFLTLLPAELWNGRNVECPIAWRCGIYVETRRATFVQAAVAPFVFPHKSAPIR